MLFAAVGVEVLGSETAETNLRTVLLPCYLQLLGWRCWGARLRRRICGRCCYHAICSCWGGGAGERDCGDGSADAAVTMLFAAVGVQVLGSKTEETNLRTLLLPCYLQLLGWRCWGARLPRRICGRCCYYAICSCWGGGAGERDSGDESDRICGRCCMVFAAVGVEVLGSETEETNLRTLLVPCYLQLLGWRCCGARRRRRICGRCGYHAICSCWGAAAGERDCGDESAAAAVAMLFAAVGVQLLGSETAEMNLRTVLLPCYLQLLGWRCWGAAVERDCGDESADGAVTMLFAAVWVEVLGSETAETNLRTVLLPCYLQLLCSCWDGGAAERDCGDESADGAVTMLLPCYLQLLGWRCWGARLRRRICRRCCYHAICSCWGGGAGERDCGDESPDGAVTMLFAAVGVEVLGSETAETNLRTVLLPCYLQLLGWRCWGARLRRRICGRCCYHAICSCWGAAAGERDGGDESVDAAVACYLQLLGRRCWGGRRRRRICGRCCYHAICSCWGAAAGERDGGDESVDAAVACYLQLLGRRCWGGNGGDESADGAVAMLFAAVGVQLLGSENANWGLGSEETELRTVVVVEDVAV